MQTFFYTDMQLTETSRVTILRDVARSQNSHASLQIFPTFVGHCSPFKLYTFYFYHCLLYEFDRVINTLAVKWKIKIAV